MTLTDLVAFDIAKYKHDCFIFSSEGEIIHESFSFDNDREGNQFYDKKRAEGKAYRVAQSHVVKKLLRVIYSLEIEGEDFDPSKQH